MGLRGDAIFLITTQNIDDMSNYLINNGKLQVIKENPFKLEKDLQVLTESNLDMVFGLDFVKSEFSFDLNFSSSHFKLSCRFFLICIHL